jgi:hypothetical protein
MLRQAASPPSPVQTGRRDSERSAKQPVSTPTIFARSNVMNVHKSCVLAAWYLTAISVASQHLAPHGAARLASRETSVGASGRRRCRRDSRSRGHRGELALRFAAHRNVPWCHFCRDLERLLVALERADAPTAAPSRKQEASRKLRGFFRSWGCRECSPIAEAHVAALGHRVRARVRIGERRAFGARAFVSVPVSPCRRAPRFRRVPVHGHGHRRSQSTDTFSYRIEHAAASARRCRRYRAL